MDTHAHVSSGKAFPDKMPRGYKGTSKKHTVVAQALSGRRAPDLFAVGDEADWVEDGRLLRTELSEEDF